MTLAEFLAARLAEDAAIAEAAGGGVHCREWDALDPGADEGRVEDGHGEAVAYAEGAPTLEQARHIARHDPARVLREIEAKRAILTRYEFALNQVAVGSVNEDAGYGPPDEGWRPRADSHELDVRSLAAAYSDHPDYRQEWAP